MTTLIEKKQVTKTVWIAQCSFYKMRAKGYISMFIINRQIKCSIFHNEMIQYNENK